MIQFIVDHTERRTSTGLDCELPQAIDLALVQGGYKTAPGPRALATLTHRLSVLSKVHQPNQYTCQDAKVREPISKTRRAYAKRGVTQDRKAALTKKPLEALLATCDESLRGVRARALLLFAWSSGGTRRSEVTDATMEDVHKVGDRAYVFTLLRSKTNQSGTGRPDGNKPLIGRAADALEAWLESERNHRRPDFSAYPPRRLRR